MASPPTNETPEVFDCLFIPSIKACNAYGLSRGPKEYSSNTNIPDFLSGPQFDQTTYGKSLRNNKPERDDIFDEVILEVLTNQPYSVNVGGPGGNDTININGIEEYRETYEGNAEEVIKTIRIAPNWESIDLNVSHTWEKPAGLLSEILEQVNSMLGVANEVTTNLSNFNQGAKGTKNYTPKMTKQMDIEEQYSKTAKESLEIPFVLFTKDDFVKDIFYPLMFLTAMSYPVRLNTKEMLNSLQDKISEQAIKQTGADAKPNDSQSFLKNVFAGYSINMGLPPPYIRVRHSSGLFYYPHMVIESLEYTFKKPYYNVKGDLGNPSMQDRAFPIWADCKLKLRAQDINHKSHYLFLMQEITKYAGAGENSIVEIIDTETTTLPTVEQASNFKDFQKQQKANNQAAWRKSSVDGWNPSQSSEQYCEQKVKNASKEELESYNNPAFAAFDCESALFESDKSKFCSQYSDEPDKLVKCNNSSSYVDWAATNGTSMSVEAPKGGTIDVFISKGSNGKYDIYEDDRLGNDRVTKSSQGADGIDGIFKANPDDPPQDVYLSEIESD